MRTGGVSVNGEVGVNDEVGGVRGRRDSFVSESSDSGEEEEGLLHVSSESWCCCW